MAIVAFLPSSVNARAKRQSQISSLQCVPQSAISIRPSIIVNPQSQRVGSFGFEMGSLGFVLASFLGSLPLFATG
jgi:hypothetical protein